MIATASLSKVTRSMLENDFKELNESIELLSSYRDRLEGEVISIAKKLHMTPRKIDSTLKNHSELIAINQTISKLIAHRERNTN